MLLPGKRLSGLGALIAAGFFVFANGTRAINPAPGASLPPVETPAPPPSYPAITPGATLASHSISELRHLKTATGSPRWPAPNPWFPLDLYQGTITRQQFQDKLTNLYDPFKIFPAYLDLNDDRVVVYPSATERRVPQFTLTFAQPGHVAPAPRWFRTPMEFRAQAQPLDKPLNGLRVAIDPGHIGGKWAQMEERSTRYAGSAPVQEGDLNLITGKILKDELTALGATVFEVRNSTDPVTPYRPVDLLPEAREMVQNVSIRGRAHSVPSTRTDLLHSERIMNLAEFLFYRCSEITERGNRIRNNFVPDITVTLYIDATPRSGRGQLTSGNANIFFVGGSYTKTEMADPEMQRRCVYKMVEGGSEIESEVASDIASTFAQRTGLGPVKYGDSSTTRQVIPGNGYVVARNLAANREYDGPVVCTEPYFMNNRVVYQRLLAGDYDGTRVFARKPYGSIFREYADCVAQGLLKAYGRPTVIAGANTPDSLSRHAK